MSTQDVFIRVSMILADALSQKLHLLGSFRWRLPSAFGTVNAVVVFLKDMFAVSWRRAKRTAWWDIRASCVMLKAKRIFAPLFVDGCAAKLSDNVLTHSSKFKLLENYYSRRIWNAKIYDHLYGNISLRICVLF
jgi:hypothetical protein